MSKRFSLRLFGLLMMASAAVAPLGCKPAGSGPQIDPPAKADNDKVKLQTLDYGGLQKLIKSHVGKVVVVDVWATW